MTARIVTLTLNPSLDLSATTERVRPEHKLRCADPELDAGGGGINVSRVVHELGARTVAVYPQGGTTGLVFAERLAPTGVTTAPIPFHGHTRLCVNIGESSTGHEYRFILPGIALTPDELAACLARAEAELSVADALVASGSLPPGVPDDTYAALARRTHAKGRRFVLDTSGPALRKALGSGLFLVKPSRREFAEMLGESLEDVRALADACRRVHRQGAAEVIVVSMGREGALLTTRDGQWLANPPRIQARSAVGAGDSFVAALTLSLLRGEAPEVALAWGTAAGAAALLTPGTSLCHREDVERLRPRVEVSRFA